MEMYIARCTFPFSYRGKTEVLAHPSARWHLNGNVHTAKVHFQNVREWKCTQVKVHFHSRMVERAMMTKWKCTYG